MARFCRNCGKPIAQDEKFCHNCGCALIAPSAPRKFCKHCGNEVSVNASFCRSCGQSLAANNPMQPVTKQSQEKATPQAVQTRPDIAVAVKESQVAQQMLIPHIKTLSAATTAGELDLGELTATGLSNVSGAVTKVLAPVNGVLHGAGSFFKGIITIFKKPSALIGVILITILWFVLAMFRDSDSLIVKILSWITFSEGGFDRSVIGALGGVLGKGTVAAALISLFGGGMKNTFKGMKALFTGRSDEKRGVAGILIGILMGVLLYFAFTGKHASASTAMAGISGIILSLQALGGGKGKLYDMALSLTSRKNSGSREARRGKCDGLLTGLTIGFALAVTFSVLLSIWKIAEELL